MATQEKAANKRDIPVSKMGFQYARQPSAIPPPAHPDKSLDINGICCGSDARRLQKIAAADLRQINAAPGGSPRLHST
jgi:hypothetical protein